MDAEDIQKNPRLQTKESENVEKLPQYLTLISEARGCKVILNGGVSWTINERRSKRVIR